MTTVTFQPGLWNESPSTPLKTLPVRDIYPKADLVQESRSSSDSFDASLLSPLPLTAVEGDDKDIASNDNETDCEEAFLACLFMVFNTNRFA